MDYRPFFISIQVAFIATIVTFFLGLFAAQFFQRLNKGKAIADAIFTLPMILPPTVVGFFLLLIFGNNSPLGQFLQSVGINVVFTRTGAIIASIVVAFPMMYKTTLGAFEQVDENVINAAKTLGLSNTKIFWKVKVPMAKAGILAGSILAFARALGEFGATIMIAGNIPGRTQTMSIAIFSAVSGNNRPLAFHWVLILMALSFVMIFVMNFFARRRWV